MKPEGTIPELGNHIRQILQCSQEEFDVVRETVEAVFETVPEGGRRDKGLHAQRTFADSRRKVCAENGTKGGDMKAKRDRERRQSES